MASEICFWPRTLKVGPASSAQLSKGHLHRISRPASRTHPVHGWSLPLLESPALLLARPTQAPMLETASFSTPHVHKVPQLCLVYSSHPHKSSSTPQAQPPALLDPVFPTNPSSTQQQGKASKGKLRHAPHLLETLQWFPLLPG